MRRPVVLLTDCLSKPCPEIARRLAETGAMVLLNSQKDGPELEDLLQEITESGGRAVACNLDPNNQEGFKVVSQFVESMAGPITGVVLASGETFPVGDLETAEAETVETAVDWCRLVMPAEGVAR